MFVQLFQKSSRRLRQFRRRKSSSVPEGAVNSLAAVFLAGKCPNLGRDSISCCRKIGEIFPAASKFAGKPFQQGISDSHSLLKFSDYWDHCFSLGVAAHDEKKHEKQRAITIQSAPPKGNNYNSNEHPMQHLYHVVLRFCLAKWQRCFR